ncbi:MAG: hypothetical protein AAFP02_13275, partial [Bacteroidota bacterium]
MFDPVLKNDAGYPNQVSSSDDRLKIAFTGYAEPNNGRELLRVDVYFDDELINDRVFHKSAQGQWNYVQYPVTKLMLAAPDQDYYFVPTERAGMVIRSIDGQMFPISAYLTSAKPNYWRLSFVGNVFYGQTLILVYSNQIAVMDLEKMDVQFGLLKEKRSIFDLG